MNILDTILPEVLIENLGWMILHSLWQGTIIALLLWLALRLYTKASSNTKYGFCITALITFLMACGGTFIYMWDSDASATIISEGFSLAQPIALTDRTTVVEESSLFLSLIRDNLYLVTTIWVMGVMVFLLRLSINLIAARSLRHSGLSPVPIYWQERLSGLKSKLSINRKVRLWESRKVIIPATIGVLKPLILLPVGTINNLNPQDVEAIIAHELAHIKRYDYLVNILQSIVEALFYYHPAVWWISSKINEVRESCCDDIVTGNCVDSLAYAKALLRVNQFAMDQPVLALRMTGPKGSLARRIHRILYQPKEKTNIMEKISVFLILCALFATVGFTDVSNASNNPQDKQDDPIEMGWNLYGRAIAGMDTDTIRPGHTDKEVMRIVEESKEGDRIEMEVENGTVNELMINGEIIPPESYIEHSGLIEKYLSKISNIQVPNAPPIPPHPPKPDAAPTSPTPKDAPAPDITTPKPEKKNRMEVRVMVIDEDDGGEEYEIKIGNGENIVIKGHSIEKGDTIIIIDTEEYNVLPYEEGGMLWKIDGNKLRSYEEELARMDEYLVRTLTDSIGIHKTLMDLEINVNDELEIPSLMENKELMEKLRKAHEHGRRILHEQLDLTDEKNMIEKEMQLFEVRSQRKENARHLLDDQIRNQLISDGLISKNEPFELQLTGKYLKVNGKKQEEKTHKKYRELYEKATGLELTKSSRINIIQE